MRSPGVMMAVVNTPDNIPAANNWGYLRETMKRPNGFHLYKRCNTTMMESHPRENIIGAFLLQFLAQTKSKETHSKHRCNSNDGGRHAFVEPFHTLWEMVKRQKRGARKDLMEFIIKDMIMTYKLTSLVKVFLKQSKVPLYRRVSPGFGLAWVCKRTWEKKMPFAATLHLLQFVHLSLRFVDWKNSIWPRSNVQKMHSAKISMQLFVYRNVTSSEV